jgi:sarcosine oxidase subunit alpha
VVYLDGKPVTADADASIASALVGDGELLLARSPKFHRPRGPSCMRGGCDGCLMRVDGTPNVMTCLQRAHDGARVERQNVILSAKLDVLRATDWFFAKGMNHHEMFAGVPGIQTVMLNFARRVSGLGELPDAPSPARGELPVLEVDALVVGGGAAGTFAARALGDAGLSVVLCDDRPALGGALLSLPPGARVQRRAVDEVLDEALEALARASVDVRVESTALGVLEGDDWLLAHPRDGLCRVRARAHVLATGGHDPTPVFEGNDLPGVMSVRAAGLLLREGVLCGQHVVVDTLGAGGDRASLHAKAFAEAARAEGAEVELLERSRVASVRGLGRVRSVVVHDETGRASHRDCDAVLFDGPVAPTFELALQAGAATEHVAAGYRVSTDADGRALRTHGARAASPAPLLFAVGELTGVALDLDAFRATAQRMAASIHGALRGGGPR